MLFCSFTATFTLSAPGYLALDSSPTTFTAHARPAYTRIPRARRTGAPSRATTADRLWTDGLPATGAAVLQHLPSTPRHGDPACPPRRALTLARQCDGYPSSDRSMNRTACGHVPLHITPIRVPPFATGTFTSLQNDVLAAAWRHRHISTSLSLALPPPKPTSSPAIAAPAETFLHTTTHYLLRLPRYHLNRCPYFRSAQNNTCPRPPPRAAHHTDSAPHTALPPHLPVHYARTDMVAAGRDTAAGQVVTVWTFNSPGGRTVFCPTVYEHRHLTWR